MEPDDADRYVAYDAYDVSSGLFTYGFGGELVSYSYSARAGFGGIDIDESNRSTAFLHQRDDVGFPYNSWCLQFPIVGIADHIDSQLSTTPSLGALMWPRGAVQKNSPDEEILHVVSHTSAPYCSEVPSWDITDRIVYWRFDSLSWHGPAVIDSGFALSYLVVADPNSSRTAIVLHTDREAQFGGLNNVAYYQSSSRGTGWIDGSELGDVNKVLLTNYSDPFGPQAWLHLDAGYDNSGRLHIVWDEQRAANVTADAVIRHWNNDRGTIRPVTFGYWDSPMSCGLYNLNLAKITLGFGDGSTLCQGASNQDYVYVLHTRFAGPTTEEQADYSCSGYYNGELYLSVSSTGGLTWAPPANLTNTKTPSCNPGPADSITGFPPRPDSVCRSENWASLGRIVSDIDILYISDLDAGAAIHGEGTWQLNSVQYFRFPGGSINPPIICPYLAPDFESLLTGHESSPHVLSSSGLHSEELTVMNAGNANLSGTISVTDFSGPPSLSVPGAGSFQIIAGAPDLQLTVNMSANGAPSGLYSGSISISHTDPTEPSPRVFPVDIFVFDEGTCDSVIVSCSNPCECVCLYDPYCDGIVNNILDVLKVINVAFRNYPSEWDLGCPVSRTDLDASGATDVIDLVKVIVVSFRAGTAEGEYVDPCASAPKLLGSGSDDWCASVEIPELVEYPDGVKELLNECQRGRCDDAVVRDATAIQQRVLGVVVHVMQTSGGTLAATDQAVRKTLAQMNEDFAQNSANIRFCLEGILHHVDDIRYSLPSDSTFDIELAEMKDLYAITPDRICNIYISHIDPGSTILGTATFPWDSRALSDQGGFWLNASGGLDCGVHVATHEMGHCLGLWHTHHGITEIPSLYESMPCRWPCYESMVAADRDLNGDLAEDTPPTPVNFGCGPPGAVDCNGFPFGMTQYANYMGYAPATCVTQFTSQQISRMHCWIGDRLSGWLK